MNEIKLLVIALGCIISTSMGSNGIKFQTTFYSYQHVHYSMSYSGLFNLSSGSRNGVFTNFPQLKPNALIEETVPHLLSKMEKKVNQDFNFHIPNNEQFQTPKLLMDAFYRGESYWTRILKLNCTHPSGGNESMIYHIVENGALFPGPESILFRIEYDYKEQEVQLHLCNFHAVNSTVSGIQDIEEVIESVPFAQFGSVTFDDYDITSMHSSIVLLSTWPRFMSYYPGIVRPEMPFILAKQAVKSSDFTPGDGIPFNYKIFNKTIGVRDVFLNVVDLEAIGMMDEIIDESYHEICQSSYNYYGNYEAALHPRDYHELLSHLGSQDMGIICESLKMNPKKSNFNASAPDRGIIIAADDYNAWICLKDGPSSFGVYMFNGSHNSSYENILNFTGASPMGATNLKVRHAMCLDYDASMGVDREDLTVRYCSRLATREAIERCLQRVLRDCQEGTEYQQAITDGDNSLSLLQAIFTALRMMQDTLDPEQPSLIAMLYQYVMNG